MVRTQKGMVGNVMARTSGTRRQKVEAEAAHPDGVYLDATTAKSVIAGLSILTTAATILPAPQDGDTVFGITELEDADRDRFSNVNEQLKYTLRKHEQRNGKS